MDILSLAAKNEDYIIGIRRYFHENPELSWEEYNTTDKIEKELRAMGLEVRRFQGKTGLTALLKGNKPGKRVMLRADIDALPIEEHADVPFKSKNGKMHACGHDCHASMLLGAAKILNELKDEISGEVVFLFQAAEETCCGAEYYVKEGILNGIDAIFGMHIWGTMEVSKINIEPGPRMASCDNFKITVKGRAAHGSAPHLGVDAVVAAASIVMNIQTYASRKNNPLNPLVISIGTIKGGNRFNIIADKVEMEGTIRTFSRELRKEIEGNLKEIIENTAKALGAEAELEYWYFPGPVINDEKIAEIARNSAVKLFGEEQLIPFDKLTGSEDFAYYMEKIPGTFAFIGCINKEIGAVYSNHSDKFKVDESSLSKGSALYSQFAIDFLNSTNKK